ncbi:Decaprenyl diphosphate synthase-like protein [Lactarius quietus]|nr:Decaprenyl diphosphate synthase-like protein [Lactarius quietus]
MSLPSRSQKNKVVRQQSIDRFRCGCFAVFRAGSIPQHVAFVMDGNRRPACSHVDGVVTLKKVVEVGLWKQVPPSIKFVSVYAFSMDNFKRPEEEVDGLIHLFKSEILDLCAPGGLPDQKNVRLNTVGKINLFPPEVQAALAKAKEKSTVLNLCLTYSSWDEIATAINETIRAALHSEGGIEVRLLTTKVHTSSRHSNLDILIRTSGVKRLSDFLLWQCNDDTQIYFVDNFWPDFGLFDLLPIIIEHQRIW